MNYRPITRQLALLLFGLALSVQAVNAQFFLSNAERIRAFHVAIEKRDIESIKKIGTKEIIKGSGYIGWICSLNPELPQDVPIIEYLIGMGASIETEYDSSTPLSWAVSRKKEIVTAFLIGKGAEAGKAKIKGWSLPGYLIQQGASTNLFETVVSRIKPIDFSDRDGNTPFFLALIYRNLEFMKILKKYGADINNPNSAGVTPLEYALQAKDALGRPTHAEIVSYLLENGAGISNSSDGVPLLIKVIRLSFHQYADLLLEKGADPNSLDKSTTALILAIQLNSDRLMLRLLEKGADPNREANGSRPIFVALEKKPANFIPGHSAISEADIPYLSALIRFGADLTVKDKDGNTPYTIAWKASDRAASAYLAEHGAVDNDGKPIGDEAAYHFERSKGSIASLTRYLELFPKSPYAAECERLISDIKTKAIAAFPFEIQTALGGQLGEALKDKSMLTSAAESLGYLPKMQSFLKGTKIKVIVAANGNTLVFGLTAFDFNRNLLVKNATPDRLDYILVGDISIVLRNVLKVYAARIMEKAKAYAYQADYFIALEKAGSTCLFSFQPSGALAPITFIDGAGKQYPIQGEDYGSQYFYIQSPLDKVTGTFRTSSLLYTFFGSMTGTSSD